MHVEEEMTPVMSTTTTTTTAARSPPPIFTKTTTTTTTLEPPPQRPRRRKGGVSTRSAEVKKVEPRSEQKKEEEPLQWQEVKGVTVVSDRAKAKAVVENLYRHKDKVFACDTEVSDINVKTQGPVGNGKVRRRKVVISTVDTRPPLWQHK